MPWAQIIDGIVQNPIKVNPSDCFTSEWLASNPPFIEVPEETQHGAVDNGDRTYTNPSPLLTARTWDAYDFKLRFTADERKAIRTAAKTNADVEDFMDMLDTAAATGTRIKSDNALLRAGLMLMEEEGLIGEDRGAEILDL